MPGNFKKDDIRVNRTLNAIQEAFLKLLECRSFEHITVNKLCEGAQISRGTFYLHYNDKYDLLKSYMTNICKKIRLGVGDGNNCIWDKGSLDQLIYGHEKTITNILKDANKETLDLLYAFMLSLLDIEEKKDTDGKLNPRYIVLSNFCEGGMMKLLSWQVDNKFPQDSLMINTHLISLIMHIMTWESD